MLDKVLGKVFGTSNERAIKRLRGRARLAWREDAGASAGRPATEA